MKQVAFTAELRRRLPAETGVVAAAVHPGEVMTDVVRTLPGLMQGAYRFLMRPFCLSPAEGASSGRARWTPLSMGDGTSVRLVACYSPFK